MEICNIREGLRVLFKSPYDTNPQWKVGIIGGDASINQKGLKLDIYTLDDWDEILHPTYNPNNVFESDGPSPYYVPVGNIFFDSFPIEDNIKGYRDYFMTKEEYMDFVESDEFERRGENACVSDGEYGYYPVSKFTRAWLEKQPFKYIVRGM